MAIVDGSLQLGYKDSAWFTSNATLVLLAGQVVYLQQTGTYKLGDGTTQLSALSFLGGASGDMLKSVYDIDNTGVVDNAEAIKIIGRNSTGATLYKGTVIYLSGATGNRPNFVKAQANSEATSAGTFGVIADDLSNNTDGYALCLGYLDNLDTRTTATNPFTVDTLSAGDKIYLDPNNAGYITNVKPSAPNHLVYLGKVTRTSPTNGTIVFRIQNGYELNEIHDVAISSVAKGDTIEYNGTLWINVPIQYTVELIDALTIDIYAPYDLKINSVTNILNSPTTTILVGGSAYTLGNTITTGQKITITVSIAAVVRLNINKV